MPPAATVEKPVTRADAARFLTQATFGPVDADIDRLMAIGYAAWIDEQFALPASGHRAAWEAADRAMRAGTPTAAAGQEQVIESFWKQAVTGPDQLRQRVAFALSQIFVLSMVNDTVANYPRATAAWLDTLGTQGLGTYRGLIEAVSRHPLMGVYLTHLRNQKADAQTGRVPDENFAREVMQLFSIGLVELNEDGSARTNGGVPIAAYGQADITGLARVFTGFSLDCPGAPSFVCFTTYSNNGVADPDASFKPMVGYPQFHSAEEKRFLGTNIAVQGTADPAASLAQALDALAAHPNVGPFIGRQIIQRLVTSNPSPAYVKAVSQAFADNGAGVRGDLKAVVKAVLMHPEARQMSPTAGKVREPVLRLSAFLRAFPHRSDSGRWRIGVNDGAGPALGQTPLRAPSVFNFYRPGYVAPGTASAAAGLVAPELQILHETTAAAWVNYVIEAVTVGVGQFNSTLAGVALNRRDIQPDFSAEVALAGDPVSLVEHVVSRLTYGTGGAALKAEIVAAVGLVALPQRAADGSNQTTIDNVKRTRVHIAVALALASPEFQVQK